MKSTFQAVKSAQGFTGDNMYVIVGAGGFLGSHLIKAVLEKTDEKILALARTGNVFSAESNRVTVMKGDLTDEAYISFVADRVCEIKGLEKQDFMNSMRAGFLRLFDKL